MFDLHPSFFVTLKMFLRTSLSESVKEKVKCFFSHTGKRTLWGHKKHAFWKLMIYLEKKPSCLCNFSPFSSLRNNSYNNALPNVSGRHSHVDIQPPRPWQDTFLTLLPFPPMNWDPRLSQGCLLESSASHQATHRQEAWVGVTWDPGV